MTLRNRARAEQRLALARSQYENENWLRPNPRSFEDAELERLGRRRDMFANEAAAREYLLHAYDVEGAPVDVVAPVDVAADALGPHLVFDAGGKRVPRR